MAELNSKYNRLKLNIWGNHIAITHVIGLDVIIQVCLSIIAIYIILNRITNHVTLLINV